MAKLIFLFFSFISISFTSSAQNLRFAKAYGHKLLDVEYNNNPNGTKMSSMNYFRCCYHPLDSIGISSYADPVPIKFGAWVVNNTNSIKQDVYLKTQSGSFIRYSDTVSLNSGDSVKLMNTKSIISLYVSGTTYSLYEGNLLIEQDNLSINQEPSIDESKLSACFGPSENFMSTEDLGDDAAGFAIPYFIDGAVRLDSLSFHLGPNTVAGGDIWVGLYDSAAFNGSQFVGTPFYSGALSIRNSNNGGWQSLYLDGGIFTPNKGVSHIWVVIQLFSNSGTSPIELGNSKKVIQGQDAVWFFNAKRNTVWKRASDTTSYIMNPVMHFKTFIYHHPPPPPGIGLHEQSEITSLKIHPNPASGGIRIELPEHWDTATLKIFSLGGSLLLERKVVSGEMLSTVTLKPGMYLLHASENGQQQSVKLLIE